MAEPSPPAPEGPVKLEQVLWDELQHLGRHDGKQPAPALGEIYARIGQLSGEKPLAALCISGGGIRSATFNLGVIQALARLGVLGRFDYLSSVSGGGYIAGWLKAWMHREPAEKVAAALADTTKHEGFAPLTPEPRPLDHLREYSNYLTPRLGLFSADTWTAAAIIVRNLILNWLVLIPVLTAVAAAPQVALIVATSSQPSFAWGAGAYTVAVVTALWASTAIYHFRRRRTKPASESTILMWAVLPLWLACLSLSLAALWLGDELGGGGLLAFAMVWCVAIPLAGWVLGRVTAGKQTEAAPWLSDLCGIVLSGVVAGLLLYVVALFWLPVLKDWPTLFVLFAVPILLGLYLLARSLYVAFASLAEREAAQASPQPWSPALGDADREWWARLSGWVLILCVGWIGTSALVLGGHYASILASHGVAALGGVSGLITALLGAHSSTPRGGTGLREPPSPLKNLALALLAPLTIAAIVLVVANLSAWLGRLVTGIDTLLMPNQKLAVASGEQLFGIVMAFLAVPAGCTLLSWLLGWVVNVNRFSGHGFYRNRLVRAYLGASNPNRDAEVDPFTGFALRDNLGLHELAHGASPRPLSVVNACLNLVTSGERLAWQQRKAESFSMTPLYCGNFNEGYRRSDLYGGSKGISLGTAITISGAAANPNAGYHSAPLVAFLMTLFNVRLGAWLGNPNKHGEGTYKYSGPRHAWKALFGDLFARTDSRHAYVSLSDGGHFENLAAYEMILRRCRLIVVSDAGQDPGHDFEDLANLIRKVRIDFGVSIEFDQTIRILSRTLEGQHGLICAMGKVRYDLVDRGTPPGRLLYIKPTLLAQGRPVPYDVFGYSRASKQFPHEPTSDQWFSEAQFESYRALGEHLAGQLGGGQDYREPGLAKFFSAVEEELKHTVAATTTPLVA
jgi:hypothetical protein